MSAEGELAPSDLYGLVHAFLVANQLPRAAKAMAKELNKSQPELKPDDDEFDLVDVYRMYVKLVDDTQREEYKEERDGSGDGSDESDGDNTEESESSADDNSDDNSSDDGDGSSDDGSDDDY